MKTEKVTSLTVQTKEEERHKVEKRENYDELPK
jgi:hypothetical protein